jgi:hypothetical protein
MASVSRPAGLRAALARTVEIVTFYRVRALWPMYTPPDLRLWWTPWTYRFGAGGWFRLSLSWLRDRWHDGKRAR